MTWQDSLLLWSVFPGIWFSYKDMTRLHFGKSANNAKVAGFWQWNSIALERIGAGIFSCKKEKNKQIMPVIMMNTQKLAELCHLKRISLKEEICIIPLNLEKHASLLESWEQRIIPRPGSRFNIKMSSYQNRKSHCGNKMVVRSSYVHNGISYTGKTTELGPRTHFLSMAH